MEIFYLFRQPLLLKMNHLNEQLLAMSLLPIKNVIDGV